MRWARVGRGFVSAALAVTMLRCVDQTVEPPVAARAAPSLDVDGAGPIEPAPKSDASRPPDSDGGCPPPRTLAPADVGPGYLPPATVTLIRPIDGDTAHFAFPRIGEQACRFLYVDTEESFGEQTTPFGGATKQKVDGWLRAATSLVVVVREDKAAPGQPALDPFARRLSLVFVDGELVQTRLVREGLSPYVTSFGCAEEPIHSTMLHAEAEANRAGRGLWAAGHPKDYQATTRQWIGRPPTCRPNPFEASYCP